MRQWNKLRAGIAVLIIALSAPVWASSGTFEERISSGAQPIVDIRSEDGAVIVSGADTTEVVIKAKITAVGRYARDPQRASRLIASLQQSPPIEEVDGKIVIGDLKKDTHKRRLRISYVVTVPKNSQVIVRSASGNVRVSGVDGPVDATSDRGEVTLAAAGR